MIMPLVQDDVIAAEDLRAIVLTHDMALLGIDTKFQESEGSNDNRKSELLNVVFRSSFLLSHSVLEFTVKQIVDCLVWSFLEPDNIYRQIGGSILHGSRKILEGKHVSEAFKHQNWLDALLLARVRNQFAHSGGWQDRPFNEQEIERLSFAFGLNQAIGFGASNVVRTFAFSRTTIERIVATYIDLTQMMFEELRSKYSAHA